MNRRTVLQIAGLFAVLPKAAFTQTAKRFRVGWLSAGKAADANTPVVRRVFDEFRARMADRDYVEGKNLALDIRYAEADATRFPALAEELIAMKPDVLVGVQTVALALFAKTKTIPIVMNTSIDPVGAGLVQSLARPPAPMSPEWWISTTSS